jgi:hypothetical protein
MIIDLYNKKLRFKKLENAQKSWLDLLKNKGFG